jgi:hypothetical protein
MFKVTTVNLSTDATTAGPTYGENHSGDLSATQLMSLLERFRAIPAMQNAEADPHLLIAASAGRFLVRTGQGKLLLYNARDTTEPYVELTADQIVAQLERVPTGAPFAEETPPPVAPAPHRGIAAAILIAGLALNGYTLYSAFYSESVNQKTVITLLTEPAELAARQHDVVGNYATGAQPGDRVIVVGADGRVTFSVIGDARSSSSNSDDTYRLGRRETKLCLATVESGVIDILNIDTLVYYRDTYKRR